jgi:hypothetical protein
MAGLDVSSGGITVSPRLAPDWKWMGVQHLPHRGQWLSWLAVRIPELTVYTNFLRPRDSIPGFTYEDDITDAVQATGEEMCVMGFRQGADLLLFAGNTSQRTVATSLRAQCDIQGSYRMRSYNSLLGRWVEGDSLVSADDLKRGIVVTIDRRGFCLLDLKQEI